MAALSRPMAALSRPYKATMAALSRLSGRNGRFINRQQMARSRDASSLSAAKWPFYPGRPAAVAMVSKPIAVLPRPELATWPDLWIWAADGRFHIVPCKQFISSQAELFLARAGKANGRFIKAAVVMVSKPMAVFTKAGKPQWPFYQQCPLYQGLAT